MFNVNDQAAILERLGRPTLGWTVTKVTKTQVTVNKDKRTRRFSLVTHKELGTPNSWPATIFVGDYEAFAAQVIRKLDEDRAINNINAELRLAGLPGDVRHIEDAASRVAKMQAAVDAINAITKGA